MMKVSGTISVLCVSAMLLTACGGGNDSRDRQMEEAAARRGIDADVHTDASGNTRVAINAGSGQVGQGLALPADFPKDIKLPADWNLMAVVAPMPNSHAIQALSKETTAEILQKIRANLGGSGWSEVSSGSPIPQMARIGFEKEGRIATFSITENGATRAVQLVTMPKP